MIITDIDKLKQKCSDASSLEEALPIIDLLNYELDNSEVEGIGLAAIQIGILKNICIVRIPEEDDSGKPYDLGFHFVNPIITSCKIPFIMKNEGCLSFPGETVETLRYGSIIVKDLLQPEGRTFTGLAAVVVQHEIDHTLSKTMHDSQIKNISLNSNCRCGSLKLFKHCCAIIMKTNKVI